MSVAEDDEISLMRVAIKNSTLAMGKMRKAINESRAKAAALEKLQTQLLEISTQDPISFTPDDRRVYETVAGTCMLENKFNRFFIRHLI